MNKHFITRFKIGASLAALALAAGVAHAADAAAPAPRPGWETAASAGLTITRGNSRTMVGNLGVISSRKWTQSDLTLGADINYGENAGAKNTDNQRAYAQFNYNLSERTFAGLRVEGMHDEIAKVDYRVTVSPLVGYYFVKEKMTTLAGEVGPSLVAEKLSGKSHNFLSLRVAERFEHKFEGNKARVWQSAEYLPELEHTHNYILNFEVGAEAALVGSLSLQTKILDTYDNEPSPGRQKNDFKWITGVAYKF